jgi:hypothetical protein
MWQPPSTLEALRTEDSRVALCAAGHPVQGSSVSCRGQRRKQKVGAWQIPFNQCVSSWKNWDDVMSGVLRAVKGIQEEAGRTGQVFLGHRRQFAPATMSISSERVVQIDEAGVHKATSR